MLLCFSQVHAESIEEWFKDFHSTYLEKGIQPSDCWNMDKSGFQIGIGRNQKIITKDICRQSYIGSASNRELVVAVHTVLSYPSIGLGREVEGGLVLAGEECQGVRRGLVERGGGDT